MLETSGTGVDLVEGSHLVIWNLRNIGGQFEAGSTCWAPRDEASGSCFGLALCCPLENSLPPWPSVWGRGSLDSGLFEMKHAFDSHSKPQESFVNHTQSIPIPKIMQILLKWGLNFRAKMNDEDLGKDEVNVQFQIPYTLAPKRFFLQRTS